MLIGRKSTSSTTPRRFTREINSLGGQPKLGMDLVVCRVFGSRYFFIFLFLFLFFYGPWFGNRIRKRTGCFLFEKEGMGRRRVAIHF
jgi:hypothetical protein